MRRHYFHYFLFVLWIRIRDPVLFCFLDPWIRDPDSGWEKNPDPG